MKTSKNKNFKEEYCASIVRIGEIFPIDGRDRIVKTMVNGLSIVIGKDDFSTGDVAVYISNECTINDRFLRLNNMFDDPELNIDKEKRGYINKHGRVRIIKLGNIPSYGLLINPKSLALFVDEPVDDVVKYLNNHVGEDFDEINNELFCKVYVPKITTPNNQRKSKHEKMSNKLKRFNMLIEGSFKLHYDTAQLQKNMHNINPDDIVDISVKLHGTSAIFSNILTNVPTNWFKRMWRRFVTKSVEYDRKYNLVYSSRTVIKNQYINKNQKEGGYYNDDIWGYWAKKLDGLIPNDVCIYCEIVGYTPKGSYIQKGYDYGCLSNSKNNSKLMVYRVVKDGCELNISDVIKFGKELGNKVGGDLIIDFPLLYHGTLRELYPDISVDTHWHENVLERLKNEKSFKMEMDEPMCSNSVPREGFVLRKEDDPLAEAWKLKTVKFSFRESKQYDEGIVDIEAMEGYSYEENE